MNARALLEMYGLPEINKINRAQAAAPEDPWSRESSFVVGNTGIVLHSASLRSTAFINSGPDADEFLQQVKRARTPQERSQIINSYVAGSQQEAVEAPDTARIVDQLIDA
jgi:hypothetical protein